MEAVAARTGHFAVFDGADAVQTAWPEVDGSVDAIVSDGAGGWFIGGDFAHVGGQRRAGLAHIAAGGALDGAWAPAAEGTVRALALVGATVYAGGEFTAINGQPRSRLAALERVGGQLLAGTPEVDGSVHALAAADGVIYVGGEFARIGGADRHGLAAFGAADGALSGWNPRAEHGGVRASRRSSSTAGRCTWAVRSRPWAGSHATRSRRSTSRPAR